MLGDCVAELLCITEHILPIGKTARFIEHFQKFSSRSGSFHVDLDAVKLILTDQGDCSNFSY